jgi:hypothetical protein
MISVIQSIPNSTPVLFTWAGISVILYDSQAHSLISVGSSSEILMVHRT